MLDVDNLMLASDLISDNYVALTNTWNGVPNPEMTPADHERCEYAIRSQASDSQSDRLGVNYEANLRLSDMFLYTVLWDIQRDVPVQLCGAQMMGPGALRMLSRYYIFSDYRVRGHGNLNTSDKLADFDLLNLHVNICQHFFKYLFISRDKGILSFKRLKRSRPDVFDNWYVIPDPVELRFHNNFQGCMVRGEPDIPGFISSVKPD